MLGIPLGLITVATAGTPVPLTISMLTTAQQAQLPASKCVAKVEVWPNPARGALIAHAKWYLGKFGATEPAWYLFPFGKPQPTDPARPMTSLKTVWAAVKKDAGVTGRWHDNRHTFITDLAESGEAGDETIRDLAGHVSKQMLKHYSHIRTQAKRRAVDALVKKPLPLADSAQIPVEGAKESAKAEKINLGAAS